MIKIFFGENGRTVLVKATEEVIESDNPRLWFPEITTAANVAHSSIARRFDIAIPASPADIFQAIEELAELEKGTRKTIFVATCSPFVVTTIHHNCKECRIVPC